MPPLSPAWSQVGGQQIGGDGLGDIVAGQDQQPLHDVAQLADIARPAMGLQHRHGVVADMRMGRPPAADSRFMKWAPALGMSSRRSASDGIRTGTTLRR